MTSRSRVLVLAISTPIIAFAFIGGYLGQALAKDDTYQHLRVFEDVVSLVINNYVEPVDVKEAMKGAMRGLADNLDPDSAFLTPDLVTDPRSQRSRRTGGSRPRPDAAVLPARRLGARRFARGQGRHPSRRLHPRHRQSPHARHVGVRRQPAAARRAGIKGLAAASSAATRPIRTMVDLVRERVGRAGSHVADGGRHDRLRPRRRSSPPTRRPGSSRPSMRWRRPVPRATSSTCAGRRAAIWTTASPRRGCSSRAERWACGSHAPIAQEPIAGAAVRWRRHRAGRAARRHGHGRTPPKSLPPRSPATTARISSARNTLGRAARQRLVKLPDQSGLWLTYLRYLTPAGDPIHEKGLMPDVEVEPARSSSESDAAPAGRRAPEARLQHLSAAQEIRVPGRFVILAVRVKA